MRKKHTFYAFVCNGSQQSFVQIFVQYVYCNSWLIRDFSFARLFFGFVLQKCTHKARKKSKHCITVAEARKKSKMFSLWAQWHHGGWLTWTNILSAKLHAPTDKKSGVSWKLPITDFSRTRPQKQSLQHLKRSLRQPNMSSGRNGFNRYSVTNTKNKFLEAVKQWKTKLKEYSCPVQAFSASHSDFRPVKFPTSWPAFSRVWRLS